MRCKICDIKLTFQERVTYDFKSEDYLDTCSKCQSVVNETHYYDNYHFDEPLEVDIDADDEL
jgi:transcription initiation factor IIE alpha subunit